MFGYLGSYSSAATFPELMLKMIGLLAFKQGRRTSLYGIDPFKRRDRFREDFAKILDLAAAGSLSPVIDSVMPLERAMQAQERLTKGEVRGKIILDCS